MAFPLALVIGVPVVAGGLWYWWNNRAKESNNNPLTKRPYDGLVTLEAGSQLNVMVGALIDFSTPSRNGTWIPGSTHAGDPSVLKKVSDSAYQAVKKGKTTLVGELIYNPSEVAEGKAPEKRSYSSEVWVF